jgi:hypothetical protein
MSDRGKAFLACLFTVVLGSILGALVGIPFIWWGSLDGFALQIFGVLVSMLGLVSGAIIAAVFWARRARSQGTPRSRVAAIAVGLYFGFLLGTLLLGWAILQSFSGQPGPRRGFFGDL